MERRKHRRFPATAFLNRPVLLLPILPFIGRSIKGKLIDLSAGGLAILINHIIPQDTLLNLTLTFPDGSVLNSDIQVRHMVPRDRGFLHGMEFLTLDQAAVDRIEKMSADYIDCERQIENQAAEICKETGNGIFTFTFQPISVVPPPR